jgi:hypothetical protein
MRLPVGALRCCCRVAFLLTAVFLARPVGAQYPSGVAGLPSIAPALIPADFQQAPANGPTTGVPQTLLQMTPTPPAPPTPGTPADPTPKAALDNPLEALKAMTQSPALPAPPIVSPAVLGTDRKLNVTWDDGGFRFRSADSGFNLHIGGRLMTDEIWWSQ